MSTSQRSKQVVTWKAKHVFRTECKTWSSTSALCWPASRTLQPQPMNRLWQPIDKMVDKLATDHNTSINQSIVEISEVQEKLQRMERNAYFSNTSLHKADN
uniref:Uncharacterized protein n=1 Tax=Ditylenchus dipsaci TaxID=166011 RepID=A0A915ETZ0_9BILA